MTSSQLIEDARLLLMLDQLVVPDVIDDDYDDEVFYQTVPVARQLRASCLQMVTVRSLTPILCLLNGTEYTKLTI